MVLLHRPAAGTRPPESQALLALAFFAAIAAIDIALIHFTFGAAEQLRGDKETSARLYESQCIMFQDLQHRGANNMQFVAALLTLHKRSASRDPAHALEALDEARRRLDTVSRIHRHLYAPERLDLPTDLYLRELCRDLLAAAGNEQIDCVVASPDLPLDVMRLTTLSMLVAEVVTNSLKHAYRPGEAGRLRLTVTPHDGARYELAIADDGRGLPAGADLAGGDGLGWRIIQGLASQLGGEAEVAAAAAAGEGGRGTVVRVAFILG